MNDRFSFFSIIRGNMIFPPETIRLVSTTSYNVTLMPYIWTTHFIWTVLHTCSFFPPDFSFVPFLLVSVILFYLFICITIFFFMMQLTVLHFTAGFILPFVTLNPWALPRCAAICYCGRGADISLGKQKTKWMMSWSWYSCPRITPPLTYW